MTIKVRIALASAVAALGLAIGMPVAQGADPVKLGTTLTPFGAERAGNKEGTIPAWEGGYVNPKDGLNAAGRRIDPFAADKPLYSITAKNMAQHEGKLSEGIKAMLQKYPDFRLDVYPTRRTAAAPQWVYDNTARNSFLGKLIDGGAGPQPANVYGGIPFPIPSSGIEAIWNHELRWRPPSIQLDRFRGYMVTAEGRPVHVLESNNEEQTAYYLKDQGNRTVLS